MFFFKLAIWLTFLLVKFSYNIIPNIKKLTSLLTKYLSYLCNSLYSFQEVIILDKTNCDIIIKITPEMLLHGLMYS